MIRAVIFDCFGVLYGGSIEVLMASSPPDRRAELEDINKQSDYGYISRQEFITEVARLVEQTPAQINALLEQAHVRNRELIAMIHALRQRHPAIKVGLLSNVGSDTIERLFTPDELRQLFDAVVLSYAEHVTKPSREAFELAADRLGVSPSQCVMIDDRLDNCSGAEAAGMHAILHTANSRTMVELEELLGE
ncbi:MAG: HAD family phosphatase [Candidatus Nanosynbacter sp.]|nr:HAD family phosphatase [Candidatus Nanosynbacter sp.]